VFWLSHHPPEELHRACRLGGVHVCARCLGVYPVLLAGLLAQFALRTPLWHRWDVGLVVLLTLPALLDWAYGRFRTHAFGNLWRLSTGVLLGVALSRSLYVHLQRPLPAPLLVQGALVTAVVLAVILAICARRGAE
jgi:uncharacterized membrane protein